MHGEEAKIIIIIKDAIPCKIKDVNEIVLVNSISAILTVKIRTLAGNILVKIKFLVKI